MGVHRLLTAMIVALPMVASPNAHAVAGDNESIVGRASVIDGDTIEIAGERIRIHGIDAPESAQLCQDGSGEPWRCGAASANALDLLLSQSRPTQCTFVDRDRYGRFVGNCFRADGVNVASALVKAGMAMDWPRYSGGAYAKEQSAAATEKAGIWQGDFQPPWEWRAEGQRSSSSAPSVTSIAPGNCSIKGNVSRSGERIYHVPDMRDYDKTQINESAGERWFCSEAEARDAGWRRAAR